MKTQHFLPDIRIVNGKPVYFYSLVEIESIIKPEDRLPPQDSDNWFLPRSLSNGMKKTNILI